ncbi:Cysteine-rich receptor-like protein kinase 2 [Acorus calamus]|uniref:Cysteine-rich receptor-like protein kinase 2 n=1 Tax=Acorus calamus TaxID=4465 RepID=A0AAV9FGI0_ACOCL|nr:Cysteine-rich receptor-like protein kinase 2 [Acorus calamus]
MVWNYYNTNRLPEAVDPILSGQFRAEVATRVLQIGLLCTQASAELRPSMSVVAKMLTDGGPVPPPSQPPFLNSNAENPFGHSSSRPGSCSVSSGRPRKQAVADPLKQSFTVSRFMSSMEYPKKLPLLLLILSSLTPLVTADARAHTIETSCTTTLEHNTTAYVPNFIGAMDRIAEQMKSNGSGLAVLGVSPDRNYGFAQCYGDLSLFDCVLCYAEARTVLPKCFPFTGGRIYLDGCFMRSENYSFFDEFVGPNDKAVCGNATTAQDGVRFTTLVKQAVSSAVAAAPLSGGYARASATLQGESAYVLANCWWTINRSNCAACLSNASKAALGCLPGSEGRALYTGCFLRYSNTDFLNAIPGGGHSEGSNDTVKRASALYNSSLNFKYSTLERATGSFDLANKLGQGGFGSVYKGVLADGREIAVKRLFFNNKHRALDFYNEVNIISSVEHKNLVRLLGCSCSGPESLLVYEFLANKSLDRFIFDEKFRVHGQIRSEAWKHFHSETIEELIDPNILLHGNQYRDAIVADISRVVHVALLCTQENPLLRPPMSKTLHMLLKKDEQLPVPTKPPFTDEKTMELNDMCGDQCEHHNATSASAATISETAVYGSDVDDGVLHDIFMTWDSKGTEGDSTDYIICM